MASPSEKLATALESLKKLQDNDIVGIKHTDIKKPERELLKKQGFIREVVKGWYISVPPNEHTGESTSWYASFWKFCARFLPDRYGDDYCLSA